MEHRSKKKTTQLRSLIHAKNIFLGTHTREDFFLLRRLFTYKEHHALEERHWNRVEI